MRHNQLNTAIASQPPLKPRDSSTIHKELAKTPTALFNYRYKTIMSTWADL